jgi:hypothetical protein
LFEVTDTSSILETCADPCKSVLLLYLVRDPLRDIMRNLNRFLVLGLLAAASVFMTGLVSTTILLQEADAAQCKQNLVAVCGVCVNANVIGQRLSQQCDT